MIMGTQSLERVSCLPKVNQLVTEPISWASVYVTISGFHLTLGGEGSNEQVNNHNSNSQSLGSSDVLVPKFFILFHLLLTTVPWATEARCLLV